LLPASVQDFVGEDHLARFVLALVLEHLELGEIEAAYVYKFLFDLTDGKNWPARFHTAAVCSFS
jgi:hypothetical protein